MKIHLGNSLKLQGKLTLRKTVLYTSIAMFVALAGIFIYQLRNPEKAYAVACDSAYLLDWSVPATYTVSCGEVNASNWSVKGTTCSYNSPVLNVGGVLGGPNKQVDILVRINQSGNTDSNDTAWVYMYSNETIVNTYTCIGGVSSAVFTASNTIPVTSGGTYKVVIKLKNDKTNELWQIKNGDVTTCVHPIVPLPITLGSFTADAESSDEVQLKWFTFSEINNQFFTIERSKTGNDYKEITRVDGAGNSTSENYYECTDKAPLNGINYYRLRQTDFDGISRTSSTIKVEVSKTKKKESTLQVYPNPFSTDFTVNYESDTEQDIEVRLVSLDGRSLMNQVFQAKTGLNIIKCFAPARLKQGNYMVQVVTNDKVKIATKVICK